MLHYGQSTSTGINTPVQVQNRNENNKQIDETADKRPLINYTVQQEKIEEEFFGKLQPIQAE